MVPTCWARTRPAAKVDARATLRYMVKDRDAKEEELRTGKKDKERELLGMLRIYIALLQRSKRKAEPSRE